MERTLIFIGKAPLGRDGFDSVPLTVVPGKTAAASNSAAA
jgi:hypothetical protein